MLRREITQTSILRVLLAGFALVIALLAVAAFVGVRGIRSIQANAESLVRQQAITNRLIDELQKQQSSLTEIFSVMARDPDSVDLEILEQLDRTQRNLDRIVAEGGQTPQRELWRQLRQASAAFSTEARRLLNEPDVETFASRELFRLHGEFVSVIGKLIEASYREVIAAQQQIDRRSQWLMQESLIFVGACFPLALVFTALTVRMTAQLVRRIEWQAGELSRVSWHMLEDQESTARRFSHELHDELGQSLTAVKANLSALGGKAAPDGKRLEDCMHLVDEAIGNVRQLSQLLRPTILDDFGLEAGLRWLSEGFTHRTGIEVEFRGETSGRLPDETETHLFRIAQEALTNVARHSGATRVGMVLERRGEDVVLAIHDNGRGLDGGGAQGLGMIGMRARARSTGGDVAVHSRPGEGVAIEVRVPAAGAKHEREDPHPVG
jgi:signal transduction histidine kinase